MTKDEAFSDPILKDLTLELSAVAGRFAARFTELTGVHMSTDDARDLVVQTVLNESTRAAADGVASFASARVARGLPALARRPSDSPDTPVELTLKFDGASAKIVHQLSVQLHGAVSEEYSRRVLVAAFDRGMSSLKRELGWLDEEG